MAAFYVGEKFTSYKEFVVKLENFKKTNYVDLHKRNSRSISAANHVKRNLNEQLEFYELKYACVHGGKKFKSRGSGQRQVKYSFIFILLFYFTLKGFESSTKREFECL